MVAAESARGSCGWEVISCKFTNTAEFMRGWRTFSQLREVGDMNSDGLVGEEPSFPHLFLQVPLHSSIPPFY
jgi:hypothetical protein